MLFLTMNLDKVPGFRLYGQDFIEIIVHLDYCLCLPDRLWCSTA